MRYVGAISDTDILINLAIVNRFDILERLFQQIIIPWFVFDVEIKNKAGKHYGTIVQAINKDGSIFQVLNRKEDVALNRLSKEIIEDKKKVIGPGESECAGYATALRIPIIISDNYTEFKYLTEYITITHRNILALCVHFKEITMEDGEKIFNDINSQLKQPSQNSFDYFYSKSMKTFATNGWNEYLGIK